MVRVGRVREGLLLLLLEMGRLLLGVLLSLVLLMLALLLALLRGEWARVEGGLVF